ncbi:MAG: ORF6N domain-containing protein [Bacteroidetes bacterium]|nr:MAG: ORF6N domain-containing protein [Bacteroidota bacterium]
MQDIEKTNIIADEVILNKIIIIRNQSVMVDSDMAELYGVSTKRLNEAVKRNMKRFPVDFMFQLTQYEKEELVANCDHLRKMKFSPYLPFVFTEHGAVMLASVLNSERAIHVNIQIVRIFNKIREIMLSHKDLLLEIQKINSKLTDHEDKILLVFEYLKQFENAKTRELEQQQRPKIGFKPESKNKEKG